MEGRSELAVFPPLLPQNNNYAADREAGFSSGPKNILESYICSFFVPILTYIFNMNSGSVHKTGKRRGALSNRDGRFERQFRSSKGLDNRSPVAKRSTMGGTLPTDRAQTACRPRLRKN